MSDKDALVAVYTQHESAEEAVQGAGDPQRHVAAGDQRSQQ